jgi:hypothetical protein
MGPNFGMGKRAEGKNPPQPIAPAQMPTLRGEAWLRLRVWVSRRTGKHPPRQQRRLFLLKHMLCGEARQIVADVEAGVSVDDDAPQ